MEPGGKCYFLRAIVLSKCFESRLPTYKPNNKTHRHTDTQTHRHTDTQTHRHTDTYKLYNKAHRVIVTTLYVRNDNKESQLKICISDKRTIHGFTIEVDLLVGGLKCLYWMI